MEIRVVVDRSPSPPGSPEECSGSAVRLKFEETDRANGLAGVFRKLAAVVERSGSSGDTGSGEGEPSLRVAVELPAGADGGDAARTGGNRLPAPLPLRPPPPRRASSPNRADLEFVSHELRTPINAVMGYTSLLRERVYGELTADQAEAVERIRTAARSLLSALDHLRNVAELELGRFEGNPDGGDAGDDERRTAGDVTV